MSVREQGFIEPPSPRADTLNTAVGFIDPVERMRKIAVTLAIPGLPDAANLLTATTRAGLWEAT